MMYVHVFLFIMNIIIMYVLWVGRRCNLLMGWHKGACLYHDVNDAPICIVNMRGGMVHWMNVSIGNAISHINLYFKKRMEPYMAAALYIVFPYAKGHVLSLCHEGKSLTWEKLEHDMCCLNSIQPTLLILYHFQALKKLISASKWWDGHLLNHDLRQQDDGQRWSQRRDYCHHPMHHMTLSPHVFWSTYGEGKLLTICIRGWARRLTEIYE